MYLRKEKLLNFREELIDCLFYYEQISKKGFDVLYDIFDDVIDEFDEYYFGIELVIIDLIRDELMKKIINREGNIGMRTLRAYFNTDIFLRDYYSNILSNYEYIEEENENDNDYDESDDENDDIGIEDINF